MVSIYEYLYMYIRFTSASKDAEANYTLQLFEVPVFREMTEFQHN